MAMLRARACDLLAADVSGVDSHEMFLVGLCPLLDAIKLYEAGAWDDALGSAVVADEAALPRAYSSALVWTHEASIARV